MMYQTTRGYNFLPKSKLYSISELKYLQDADGKDIIGAFPRWKEDP